jgi:hypothetical protein
MVWALQSAVRLGPTMESSMRKCECGGLVPVGVAGCPNCAVSARSGVKLRGVLAIVALAASSCGPVVMATYGVPPCADGGFDCYNPPADGGTKPDGGTNDGGH